ncbi:hypothetical protein EDF56_103340 [Novosphingobium sp. PhB165]|nr:hypothetical protein EDF56_103340 [Novosphingobium sp. PhB165]
MHAVAGPRAPNPRRCRRFAPVVTHARTLTAPTSLTIGALPRVPRKRPAASPAHFRLALPRMTGHSRERFRLTPMNGRIIGEDEAILFGLRTRSRSARRLHAL